MSSEALLAALARVQDPEIRRPITELDMVRSATVADGVASIELKLTIVGCPAADRIEADVRAAAVAGRGRRPGRTRHRSDDRRRARGAHDAAARHARSSSSARTR